MVGRTRAGSYLIQHRPSLLDFPPAVIATIVEILYSTNHDIRLFLSCCKTLHQKYSFMYKVLSVSEVFGPMWREQLLLAPGYSFIQFYCDKLKNRYVQRLQITSKVPPLISYSLRELLEHSLVVTHLPLILDGTLFLRDFKLVNNSPLITLRLLHYLPRTVEHLSITLSHSNNNRRIEEDFTKSASASIIHIKEKEAHLKQFEFKAVHGWKLQYDRRKALRLVEEAFLSTLATSIIAPLLIQDRVERFKYEHNSKTIFGHLLYSVMKCNGPTLEAFTVEGVDLDLVFQPGDNPFPLPRLKIFGFDSVSDRNHQNWIHDFETQNKRNRCFDTSLDLPVLVYKRADKNGSSVHLKHVTEPTKMLIPTISGSNSQTPEIWTWRGSHETAHTQESLYLALGLNKVFQ
ncbi:CYFA0S11e02234g1_1 [Cyberlindnera fabianii]|uniref:CYFA0S11e02234g1_1 n=2 Tax=Cyberlindnera fabianii TaxID=36022 RepID=A0A061B098_CYBFA|nr:CYFA0S11e02234g1_1 [Cyberlindnera fabianii]